MYDTILLPIDRGVQSNHTAAREACKIGDQFGSDIHVLFVELDSGDRPQSDGHDDEHVTDIREYIEDSEYDVSVSTERRAGDATEEITDYARETDADLIVMATHGRTGVSRLALGSVTEATLRESPCPVLAMNTDY